MTTRRRIAAFALYGLFASAFHPSQLLLGDAKAAREMLWERIVVIGASSSSGFGTRAEIGPDAQDVKLAEAVEKMLRLKHSPAVDASDEFLFMAPEENAKKLIEKALAAKPTAIIALDFLFWFGYGKLSGRKERLDSLAKGLKLLDGLKCPVVVSLLPDMRPAIGKMLAPEQVPDPGALKALNEAITRWARGKRNVIVAPLAESLEKMRSGQAVKVAKTTWPKGSLSRVLQKDQLHPTVEGLALMAAMGLDSLRERNHALIPESAFDLRAQVIAKSILEKKKSS